MDRNGLTDWIPAARARVTCMRTSVSRRRDADDGHATARSEAQQLGGGSARCKRFLRDC